MMGHRLLALRGWGSKHAEARLAQSCSRVPTDPPPHRKDTRNAAPRVRPNIPLRWRSARRGRFPP
eukprot:4938764-Pyramimonas_sp.AAC.1